MSSHGFPASLSVLLGLIVLKQLLEISLLMFLHTHFPGQIYYRVFTYNSLVQRFIILSSEVPADGKEIGIVEPVSIEHPAQVHQTDIGHVLETRREEIETELLRFVSTIEQELLSTRDVLSILEKFKKNTTPAFADELGITCADMRSGGYEVALMRMEARVNSPQLSDVVRGLISVIRGDNGTMYFQMLSHDFKQIELRKLKSKAQKVPGKIRVFSIIMLMCFLATYLIVIAYQVIRSVGVMF